MIDTVLETLASFIIWLISSLGYGGIVVAMAVESACIPLPSEVIMPFSGFLVSQGKLDFWLVVLAGAVGCVLGSWIAYALGYFGGETVVRNLIRKFGKYVLVFEYELDEAEEWFRKYGATITFTSRLLPVIRTFISLPAGIAKMNFKIFTVYTFTGSLIWSAVLAFTGKKMGEHWDQLGGYFRKLDVVLVVIGVIVIIWYIQHKVQKLRAYQKKNNH
ncbi:MAG TPA: DedA family protein [Patescibacteria group bacterium]|nr:DedA family protein [Patescibacteria group bacterium]